MRRSKSIDVRKTKAAVTGATVTGGQVSGPRILGPTAMAPLAIAAGAIGALAIGRLAIANAVIKKLQAEEIEDCRWVGPDEAASLLSGPVGRRVGQVLGGTGPLYLEDGRPVGGVTG